MPRGYTVQTHVKEIKLNKARKALKAQNQKAEEELKKQEELSQKPQRRVKKFSEALIEDPNNQE